MAKRGRPKGVTSALKKPANVAAHHANVLIELWLAGVPLLGVLGATLASTPEQNAHWDLIEKCWRCRYSKRRYTMEGQQHTVREEKRRHTVPWKIKKNLCQLAIAHVIELDRQSRDVKWLRAQGLTEEQILNWFGPGRVRKFKPPDLRKVLEIVNRKAPPVTLRRKAAAAVDERENRARPLRRPRVVPATPVARDA
jgi:hypothetical protein